MIPSSLCVCFFFSSRRRHTSWPRDWSSDVCSSDLVMDYFAIADADLEVKLSESVVMQTPLYFMLAQYLDSYFRSEERRVGKERRTQRATENGKKKKKEQTMHRRTQRG